MNAILQPANACYGDAYNNTIEAMKNISAMLREHLTEEVHKLAMNCLRITPHIILAAALITETTVIYALLFWAARTITCFLPVLQHLLCNEPSTSIKTALRASIRSLFEFHSNLIFALGAVSGAYLLRNNLTFYFIA